MKTLADTRSVVAMRLLATTLTALVPLSASFETDAVAAESSRKLFGREIRQKLAGMELTDGVHWRDVYDRNGTLRSYADGKGVAGKWTIRKDELCVAFGEPDDGCYEVFLHWDRVEMRPSRLGLSIEGTLQPPTDRD